jgi:hypothetical protein
VPRDGVRPTLLTAYGGFKQNVFDDFLAAARYLVESGWTAGKLAIEGASNGGLLMGAATTQAPGLFRAVMCGVPLLDMVRYHKFGLDAAWISEGGRVRVREGTAADVICLQLAATLGACVVGVSCRMRSW